MFQISDNRSKKCAEIIGDFWDFDRLYFAIAKYIGDFGPNRECPFPDHTMTAQSLLGLSYELRKAQEGQHELFMQYNGYPMNWFEDSEKLRELDIKFAKIEYLEDMGLLDDYDEDTFDPDDVDDEEIEDALMDFDESSVVSEPGNGLAYRTCPAAKNENALLKINMCYPEIIYYGLLLHELLKQKDKFWTQKKQYADNDNEFWGLDEAYYYGDAHVDLSRLRLLRDEIFSMLYHVLKKDAFVTHLLPLLQKRSLIHDRNLKKWTELTDKYARMNIQENEAQVICRYLDEGRRF